MFDFDTGFFRCRETNPARQARSVTSAREHWPVALPLKYLFDDRRNLWMRLNDSLSIRPHHVSIADWRKRRIDRLLSLFEHSLFGFLREIVNKVLRH